MSFQIDSLPWTHGNQIKLLCDGAAFFPALLSAIDSAHQEIYLESYIFANDTIGNAVCDALTQAAKRGVSVHILVDGFGAHHFPNTFGNRLQSAGVRFQIYRPVPNTWQYRRNRLRRLHRKLCVIDRTTLFVGGINIIDDHNAPAAIGPRADFAVCATGPVAREGFKAALRLWATVARSGFQAHVQHWSQHWLKEYRKLRMQISPPSPAAISEAQPGMARFLPRDNIRYRQTIVDAYLNAIQTAQHEILLAHAYFLPAFRLRHALRDAARRGVNVTILLQGSSDHRLLQYATRALYGSLLEAGISLFEYHRGFLHAKVGIIDGHWATLGSSNMDPFSLELAHEGNLEIRDSAFATTLRQRVLTLIETGSEAITLNTLRRASWASRLMRWLAYGLVRALISLAGYGKALGMR